MRKHYIYGWFELKKSFDRHSLIAESGQPAKAVPKWTDSILKVEAFRLFPALPADDLLALLWKIVSSRGSQRMLGRRCGEVVAPKGCAALDLRAAAAEPLPSRKERDGVR